MATARNRKNRKHGPHLPVDQHPSVTSKKSPDDMIRSVIADYFPSYDSVMAVAHLFPRVERPKPKTSGCWWCEDEDDRRGPLCGVCSNLFADYTEYTKSKQNRPVVEI